MKIFSNFFLCCWRQNLKWYEQYFILWIYIKYQIFHYTRCNTPKRVTSWRGPFPRHCARATQLLSKKCRSGGEPLATLCLIRPALDPQTSRSRDERVTARPSGIQLQLNVESLKVFEIQETWPKNYLKNFLSLMPYGNSTRIKVTMSRQIP